MEQHLSETKQQELHDLNGKLHLLGEQQNHWNPMRSAFQFLQLEVIVVLFCCFQIRRF